MQRVFYFVPQRGTVQRLLHDFIQLFAVANAVQLEAGGYVVVDGHGGKRIGFLKDHADTAAQLGGGGSVINADVADADLAFDARLGNGLVHAIETANESGFAATGRANQRGRAVGEHADVDVEQGLRLAVKGIQVFDRDSDAHKSLSSRQSSVLDGDANRSDRAHNQHNQHQRTGPRLFVPFIERRNGVGENL